LKVCVIGLGYIGLPTAVLIARCGMRVLGVDVNTAVVNAVKNKNPHNSEPGLKEAIIDVLDRGLLTVSTQPEEADIFMITVQTPLNPDKTANLEYVKNAAESIVPYLGRGNLIVLESTVPPKTIEQVLLPILRKSSYKVGEDLYVSYSPERVMPGRLFEELVNNDRIVGGINPISVQKTVEVYKHFVKGHIHETDAETAEMVKLMENSYRDLNIAFANELARIAERIGIDVWRAIELANTHPRVRIHKPGPGVGGHCISVDPWFLVEKAPSESRLVSLARRINDSTPYYIVQRIETAVRDIRMPVIALLGLAFKGNTGDLRESPAMVVRNELLKKGFALKIYDPYLNEEIEGKVSTLTEAARDSDCLVFLTDHDMFKAIDFSQIQDVPRTKLVFDTRNIINGKSVMDLGFTYFTLGSSIRRLGD